MPPTTDPVDILILGAGWTSTFLIPQLRTRGISYAATTRSGSSTTIPFVFDPTSHDESPFLPLPPAKTVLITFPIREAGGSRLLLSLYMQTHNSIKTNFLQLGSTAIWPDKGFGDRHTPSNADNPRKIAEDELLSLGGAVLNLAGLWGGTRNPKNWVARVAPNKEALAAKKSLHLIHGIDVARCIIAVHKSFTPGERWVLTDLRVYDWWDLASSWAKDTVMSEEEEEKAAAKGQQAEWVKELMIEEGIRSLPRPAEKLGRTMDSLEFWEKFGITPWKTLVNEA
jgi:hypothetical protein